MSVDALPRQVRGRVVPVQRQGAVGSEGIGIVGADGELALLLEADDARLFAAEVERIVDEAQVPASSGPVVEGVK